MRRAQTVWLTILLSVATSSTLSAQQSIYMLVDSIKGAEPAPHTGEFKLNDFSFGTTNPISLSTSTSGGSVGKAAFSPVKVSMRFNAPTSPSFYRHAAAGMRLPSIEIRLYNSSGKMFYKTVFENVILTSLQLQGADEAMQTMEFVYSRVKWFAPPDAAGLNPPQQLGCWDIATNARC
jgi:type VI protein secretion system component Hcp